MGRIERAKGADVLIEAFAQLEASGGPPPRLRLVGPIVDFDPRQLAERLGVSDRVELVGEVPNDRLPEHYRSATLLALPSRAEGLACVLVESLLVGRPVVATRVGGTQEIIDGRFGALVEPGDVSGLAHALANVLRDAERGRFEPPVLRERALPLSWAETGPRLEALTWQLVQCASPS